MKKQKKIKIVRSLSEIPRFKTEDEERKYWETHSLSNTLWDALYDPEVEKEFDKTVKHLRMTDRRK